MFVDSLDPRDIDARKVLPQSYLEAVRKASSGSNRSGYSPNQSFLGGQQGSSGSGGIPLDPINTLFLPRRTFGYDNIGTSMFTRLITFWALEKALINATMASARRRIRSILHVKAGIDNIWEPSAQEMDNIAGMFIQADEDPAGAVVVTRTGVDTNEVRSGQDFYKWADEWQLLNEGKLRALGANDALLSGDATYSNQEAARQFFMERVVRLRDVLTSRIFYSRLFPLTARIHGFKKRSTAELANRIRIEGNDGSSEDNNITQRQALSIPNNQLIIPRISWHKELVNKVNTAKMDLFEKLEEKGVPVKLRDWSAAGGIDLDNQLSGLESDADLRKQVATWKGSYESTESESKEEEAKLEFIKSLKNLAHSNLRSVVGSNIVNLGPLASFIFWDAKACVGPVEAKDLCLFLENIKPDDNSYRIVGDSLVFKHRLFGFFQNTVKAEIAHYLLYRSGLTPIKPALSKASISEVSACIKSSLDQYSNHGKVYKLAKLAEGELSILGQLSASRFAVAKNEMDERSGSIDESVKKHEVKDRNLVDKIGGVDLYSGV